MLFTECRREPRGAPLPIVSKTRLRHDAGRGRGSGSISMENHPTPSPSPSGEGNRSAQAECVEPHDQAHPPQREGRGAHGRRVGQGRHPAHARAPRASSPWRPRRWRWSKRATAKKGDVLATARIAGIMAAKKTHELIPLCHPLAITQGHGRFRDLARSRRHPRHRRGEGRGPDRRRDGGADGRLGRLPHHLRHAEGRRQSHGARRHPPLEKTGGRSGTYRAR